MLLFQNMEMGELQFPGLRLSQIPAPSEAPKFDLTLQLSENENAIRGQITYLRIFTIRKQLGNGQHC